MARKRPQAVTISHPGREAWARLRRDACGQAARKSDADGRTDLVTHDGYEWLYVLAGELRLILGEREFTLRPGQVAEFDTSEPHWFGPADINAVEILHLFGPRGDRAVVRTGPSPAS
jgi:mannose-6-phosphate isomerase-like protein (cupin superfamily)